MDTEELLKEKSFFILSFVRVFLSEYTRTTEAYLYCKLTNEPTDSGELQREKRITNGIDSIF